jgi:hypothetical protein
LFFVVVLSHRFGQLASRFHDAQTQRDDLSLEKEIYHICIIELHQGSYHSKTCQTEVLERTILAARVEEWIKVQWYVRWCGGSVGKANRTKDERMTRKRNKDSKENKTKGHRTINVQIHF